VTSAAAPTHSSAVATPSTAATSSAQAVVTYSSPAPTSYIAPACKVSYTLPSVWGGGFVAAVEVTNSSGAAWSGWSGSFALSTAATVQNSWGATLGTNGLNVAVTPAAYDTTVAAGGKVTFGFQAAMTSPAAPRLGAFTVNGQVCQIGS
jgi:cellulase/cellobiase CelA1